MNLAIVGGRAVGSEDRSRRLLLKLTRDRGLRFLGRTPSGGYVYEE